MAFLLVSVMAGSMLAGCGSDNASSSNDGSSKSADSSNQDSYTVKFWHLAMPAQMTAQKFLRQQAKSPRKNSILKLS